MESTEKAENECLWMVWLGEKNEHRGNFTFRSAGRLVPAFTRHARALRAPQLKILHCGCPEDVALLDFWWFKSGKITSLFNSLTKGWLGEVVDPRTCAFMAVLFHDALSLTINDLYSFNAKGKRQDLEMWLRRQISHLEKKLDTIREAQEREEADLLE